MPKIPPLFLVVIASLAINATSFAQATALPFLHPLFTSNMVLQREMTDPVWGWTAPGAAVTVVVSDQNGAAVQTVTATAGADGRWQANVGPFSLVPNNAAYSMAITGPGSGAGAQTTTLTNVLIGDVWLCSGQSNIEYTLYGNYPPGSGGTLMANSPNEISAAASNNFIRHFKVTRGTTATTPQVTFPGGVDSNGWTTTAANASAFTAVGYFMAAQIYATLNVPVGLLNSTWGGTDITPWVPADYVRLISDYTPAIDSGNQTQGYYNAMIAPATAFSIKGMLWYQGESSTQLGGPLYGALLKELRDGYRAKFGQGSLPFLAVQLCTNGNAQTQTAPVEATSSASYAEIREAELNAALADSHSRVVVTLDCGYTTSSNGVYSANVHPIDKQQMGLRAGQAALNVAYGQSTPYLSPSFDHATISGGAIRCYFNNVGSGLMVGFQQQNLTQGAAPAPSPVASSANPLTGFAVAGADGNYYPATASIDPATNTVVATSPSVASPLSVRYGWGSNPWNTATPAGTGSPLTNLYAKVVNASGSVIDGVPVSPFRNDPVAQLSVNSGSGSGSTYAPGQPVGVTASGASAGESFAFWSGDTDLLANANNAATTATLSRTYVSIRANYYLNTAPTGLSGTASSLQVGLTWNAVTNATTYSVKRSSASGGPYTTIATGLTTTSYTDNAVGSGSTWYYVVTASDVAGESPNSSQVGVTPLPPAAPAGVAAANGNLTVYLTWNAVANATGYKVSRATVSGGPYTTIAAGVPGLSYVDTGVTNGTAYYYIISAAYGNSTGASSSPISATPAASAALVRRSTNGISSASAVTGGQTDVQAFDQSTSTKWYTTNAPPGWLQYQFGNNSAWAVTQYQITSANDVSQRDPMDWQLWASNDGYTWFVLDTRTGQIFASRLLTQTYPVSNATPYRYYRLNITSNNGGSAYGIQLAELGLFSSPSDPGDKTPPVLTVPANITVLATGASGAVVNYSIAASDAVSGSLTPVGSPASGSLFAIGTTTVGCSATDLAGNVASGSFTVTVQPDFASYLGQYFSLAQLNDPTKTGPTADFDGDGRSNLLEYFEGTDPTSPDADTDKVSRDGNGNAILTFRMAKNLHGVSYTVQSSPDLVVWSTPANVSYQTVSDQGSYTVVQAAVPAGNASALFLRLRVSMP